MCNVISLYLIWYSKYFFFLILSIIFFKILPLEKLTLANLAVETKTFFFKSLILANFCSIKNLLIPSILEGYTDLSVETEKAVLRQVEGSTL